MVCAIPTWAKATAASLMAAAGMMAAQGGEQIQFSEKSSKSGPAPKSGKMEDLESRYDFLRKGGGASDAVGGSMPASGGAVVTPNANLQRKLEDYIDRKKNWIVPGAQKERGLDDFLKKEDEGIDLSGKKPKSVMERYFDGPDPKDRLKPSNSKDPERDTDRERSEERDNFDPKEKTDTERDRPESNGLAEFNLRGFLNPNEGAGNPLNRPDDRRARNPFQAPGLERNNTQDAKRAERERREEIRTEEFKKMMAPRNLTPTLSGVGDPINGPPDATRGDLNPSVPRRMESLGRADGGSSPLPNLGRDSGPRIQDSGLFDSRATVGAGSLAPTVAAPAPALAPPRLESRPVVLEFPRRKF